MRIIYKSAGVFLITFFIGTAIYFLIPKMERKIQNPQVFVEQPILSEVKPFRPEQEVQPKIFNVDNFWNDDEKFNSDFLETGEVSNVKDIKAKSGETWLGLFSENGKEILRPTKLKIKVTKATGPNELNWKEISVSEKSKPLFLLRDKNKFKSGKVNTLFLGLTFKEADEQGGETTQLKNGFRVKFYLNNTEYTLRVEKGIDNEQKQILVLLLETSTSNQIVYYIDYVGEGDYIGNLFWVGDIDRDGKLDLYMDFWNYEKGYYSSGLFLSSESEKGKLGKMIEYFMLGGC